MTAEILNKAIRLHAELEKIKEINEKYKTKHPNTISIGFDSAKQWTNFKNDHLNDNEVFFRLQKVIGDELEKIVQEKEKEFEEL